MSDSKVTPFRAIKKKSVVTAQKDQTTLPVQKPSTNSFKNCFGICKPPRVVNQSKIELDQFQKSVNSAIGGIFNSDETDDPGEKGTENKRVPDDIGFDIGDDNYPESDIIQTKKFPYEYEKPRIDYSTETDSLAFWTDSTIYVYPVSSESIMEPTIIKAKSKILGDNAVRFIPNGIEVISVESYAILIYKLIPGSNGKIEEPYCIVENHGLRGNIMWAYFDTTSRGEERLDFIDCRPDKFRVIVEVNQSLTYYNIELPSSKQRKIDELINTNENPPEVIIKSTMDKAQVINQDDLIHYYFSDSYNCFWTIEVKPNLVKIESRDYELDQNYEFVNPEVYSKEYPLCVKRLSFIRAQCTKSGILLASDPIDKIYAVEFTHDCKPNLKELFKLSANIKDVRTLGWTDGFEFVLMVVNDNELVIWAKMNNDNYGMIYYIQLTEPVFRIFVPDDLEYIFLMNSSKITYLKFAPYEKPFQYYTDYRELIDSQHRTIEQRMMPFHSKFSLVYGADFLSVKKIFGPDVYRDQDNHKFLSEFDYINQKPIVISKGDNHLIMMPLNKEKRNKRDILFYNFNTQLNEENRYEVVRKVSLQKTFLPRILNFAYMTRISIPYFEIKDYNVTWSGSTVAFGYFDQVCLANLMDTSEEDGVDKAKSITVDFMKYINMKYFEGRHDGDTSNLRYQLINEGNNIILWQCYRSYLREEPHGAKVDPFKLNRHSKDAIVDPLLSPGPNPDASETFPLNSNNNYEKSSFRGEGYTEEININQNGNQKHSHLDAEHGFYLDDDQDDNDSFFDVNDMDEDLISFEGLKKKSKKPNKCKVVILDAKALLSGEEPVIQEAFYLNLDLWNCKESPNGKYLFFFGGGGYELFRRTVDGINPKYESIRRRWRHNYNIYYPHFVSFSPDERYLAVAFAYGNKSVLFEFLRNGKIKTKTIARIKHSFEDIGSIFKFYINGDMNYLATVDDTLESEHSVTVKVYDLNSNITALSSSFSDQLKPQYIDILLGKRKRVYLNLLLKKNWNEEHNLNKGLYRYKFYLKEQKFLPMNVILKRNIINYFDSLNKSLPEQAAAFELLANTYGAIKPYQIIRDVRIPYSIFMLDRPEIFPKVFSNKVNLNTLFSAHKFIELIYSQEFANRTHSVESVSKMFDDMVKHKKYPFIQEQWVERLIRTNYTNFILNPGSRSIFTHILFSNCYTTITGLTRQKAISMVSISDSDHHKAVFNKAFVQKNVASIMLEKPQQVNDYAVYRTRIKLELTNGSEASLGLLQIIQAMPDSELRYKYKQLINYKWKMVYYYSLVYTLLFFFLNILGYFYFGYNGYTWQGVIIMIMNVVFILFDLKCFGSEWRVALKDPTNWIDILIHGASFVGVVCLMLGYFELFHSSIKLLAIVLLSIRGIMLLKMFSSLRIMIMLFSRIIYDLRWLPLILMVILVLAGTMYKVAPLPGGGSNDNLSFFESMQEVFLIMFMGAKSNDQQVNDTSSVGGIIRSIILVLGGTLLAQSIFNFVIAIFLQTFKTIDDNKDVYELRSLILDIKDFDLFLRGFQRWTKPVQSYFLILVPVPKDGIVYENETELDRIESMVKGIMVETGKKGIEQIGQKAKSVIKGHDDKIDSAVSTLKNNAAPTDPRIKKFMSAAEKISAGGTPDASDLTNTAALLMDAVPDSRVQGVLKKTTEAVNVLSEEIKRLESGEDMSIEGMLRFISIIAETTDSGNNQYATKITQVISTASNLINIMKQINTNEPDYLPKLIQKTSEVVKQMPGNSEIGKIVASLGGTLGVVSKAAIQINNGERCNLTEVFAKTAEAAAELSNKKNSEFSNVIKKVSSVTNILAEVMEETDEITDLNSIDPMKIVSISEKVVNSLIPDHNIGKVIQITKVLSKQISSVSSGQTAIKDISVQHAIKSASSVAAIIYPESTPIISKLDGIVSAIYKAQENFNNNGKISISLLVNSVKPLFENQEKISDIVGSVSGIIEIIETQVKKVSSEGTLQNYPMLIEATGDILYQIDKSMDYRTEIGKLSKVAYMIEGIVRNSYEERSDLNSAVKQVISSVELISLVSPQYTNEVKSISKTIQLIFNRIEGLSREEGEINIEKEVTETIDLINAITRERSPMLSNLLKLIRVLLQQRNILMELDRLMPSDYLDATIAIMKKLNSPNIEYLEMIRKCSKLVESLQQSKGDRIQVNVEDAFNAAAEIFSISSNEEYSKHVRVACQVANLIQENFMFAESGADVLVSTLTKMSTIMKTYHPGIEEAVSAAVNTANVVKNFGKQYKEGKENMDVNEVLSNICHLINSLSSGKYSEELQTIEAISKGAYKYSKGMWNKDDELESSLALAGKVVCSIDKSLVPAVEELTSVCKLISNLCKNTENLDSAASIETVKILGDFVKDYKPEYAPAVDRAVSVIDLAITKLNESNKQEVNISSVIQISKQFISIFDSNLAVHLDKIEVMLRNLQSWVIDLDGNQDIDVIRFTETANIIICTIEPRLASQASMSQSMIVSAYELYKATQSESVPNLERISESINVFLGKLKPSLRPYLAKATRIFTAVSKELQKRSGSRLVSDLLYTIKPFCIEMDESLTRQVVNSIEVVEAIEGYAEEFRRTGKMDYLELIFRFVNIIGRYHPCVDKVQNSLVAVAEAASDIYHGLEKEQIPTVSSLVIKLKPVLEISEIGNNGNKSIEVLNKTASALVLIEDYIRRDDRGGSADLVNIFDLSTKLVETFDETHKESVEAVRKYVSAINEEIKYASSSEYNLETIAKSSLRIVSAIQPKYSKLGKITESMVGAAMKLANEQSSRKIDSVKAILEASTEMSSILGLDCYSDLSIVAGYCDFVFQVTKDVNNSSENNLEKVIDTLIKVSNRISPTIVDDTKFELSKNVIKAIFRVLSSQSKSSNPIPTPQLTIVLIEQVLHAYSRYIPTGRVTDVIPVLHSAIVVLSKESPQPEDVDRLLHDLERVLKIPGRFSRRLEHIRQAVLEE